MKEQTNLKKLILCIIIGLGCLILFALPTIIVDPYFHFHAPINGISYEMSEERYINDGISRHMEFDGIITGTSMNQNFKPSEAEALFGGTFVKETFSGAAYKELMENLERAFKHNPGIKTVIWGMDYNGIRRDADYVTYSDYPEYLYDNNPFNDVNYVLNKEILYNGTIKDIIRTAHKIPSTTFDEYSSWERETGFDHIMLDYDPVETKRWVSQGIIVYDYEKELEKAKKNVEQNVIPVLKAHPDTDFYIFFSPYSIIYWDSLYREETMGMQIDAEKMVANMLLENENVHLFCFYENKDLINDLSLYNNKEHYSAEINSAILNWMAEGVGEITKDNLDTHIKRTSSYFESYNYNELMAKYGYFEKQE